VQALIPFDDEADALTIANGTPYGLVAGVWTRDGSRALRLARRLQCGQVFVKQLRRRRRHRTALRRRQTFRPRPREGLRGAVRFSVLKTVASSTTEQETGCMRLKNKSPSSPAAARDSAPASCASSSPKAPR